LSFAVTNTCYGARKMLVRCYEYFSSKVGVGGRGPRGVVTARQVTTTSDDDWSTDQTELLSRLGLRATRPAGGDARKPPSLSVEGKDGNPNGFNEIHDGW